MHCPVCRNREREVYSTAPACLDSPSVCYRNKRLSEQQDHQASFPLDPCLKTDLLQDSPISKAACTHTAASLWPLSHTQLLIFTKSVKTLCLWHLYLSVRFDRIWPTGSQLSGGGRINTPCFCKPNFCREPALNIASIPMKQMTCKMLVPDFTSRECRNAYRGVTHELEVQVYQVWKMSNNKQRILLIIAERVPCEIQRA